MWAVLKRKRNSHDSHDAVLDNHVVRDRNARRGHILGYRDDSRVEGWMYAAVPGWILSERVIYPIGCGRENPT